MVLTNDARNPAASDEKIGNVPGRHVPLAGPREVIVAPDGRSVAVCDWDGGLAVLSTTEITDLAPEASLPQGGRCVPWLAFRRAVLRRPSAQPTRGRWCKGLVPSTHRGLRLGESIVEALSRVRPPARRVSGPSAARGRRCGGAGTQGARCPAGARPRRGTRFCPGSAVPGLTRSDLKRDDTRPSGARGDAPALLLAFPMRPISRTTRKGSGLVALNHPGRSPGNPEPVGLSADGPGPGTPGETVGRPAHRPPDATARGPQGGRRPTLPTPTPIPPSPRPPTRPAWRRRRWRGPRRPRPATSSRRCASPQPRRSSGSSDRERPPTPAASGGWPSRSSTQWSSWPSARRAPGPPTRPPCPRSGGASAPGSPTRPAHPPATVPGRAAPSPRGPRLRTRQRRAGRARGLMPAIAIAPAPGTAGKSGRGMTTRLERRVFLP
jgi:hypothetical protein